MADAANNRSVIVYEPATQTVSIKKIGDLGKFGISSSLSSHTELRFAESSPILIQRTPKFRTHVDITTADPVRLIATLNLGKLGSIASAKRACGRLSQIYVMATPDEQRSRMVLD